MLKKFIAGTVLVSFSAGAIEADRSINVRSLQLSVLTQAKKVLRVERADFYKPDQRVASVLEEFLLAEESALRDRSWVLLFGCRHQSCMEKAAAAVEAETDKLSGVAFASFECRDRVVPESHIAFREARNIVKKPGLDCRKAPKLLVYLVRDSYTPEALRSERELLERMRGWGTSVGTIEEDVKIVTRSAHR